MNFQLTAALFYSIQGLWNLMKVSSTPKNSFTTRIRSSVLHAVGILGVLLAACLLVNCWKSIGDVGPSHRLGVGSRLLSFHQRVRGYFSTQRKSPQEVLVRHFPSSSTLFLMVLCFVSDCGDYSFSGSTGLPLASAMESACE